MVKKVIGTSTYKIVYGKEAKIPLSLKLPSLELAQKLDFEGAYQREIKMEDIIELEELRNSTMIKLEKLKKSTK